MSLICIENECMVGSQVAHLVVGAVYSLSPHTTVAVGTLSV